MILVDANILIYAVAEPMREHVAARAWLDAQFNGSGRVGLPWPSLLGFMRVVSNPRIFSKPVPIEAAWERVAKWLACPVVWTPAPTDRHTEILGKLVLESRAVGDLIPDAHLAALAIEHGLTVCSADADFARFQSVRWINPLRG